MSLHKQISPRGFEVLFFSEESVDDRWVKTVTAFLDNERSRLFMVVGGLVRSAGSQGVVDIGKGHNPRRQRDVNPGETIGVSGAIPTFVMMERNFLAHAQKAETVRILFC